MGLFANRNHQAVLLAATIVMLGWYAGSSPSTSRKASLKLYVSIATIFVFVPLIFVTGSRAGLLLMVPALTISIILIYFGAFTREDFFLAQNSQKRKRSFLTPRQLVVVASVSVVFIIALLSIFFSRSLAFDRLFGDSKLNELRIQVLPVLLKMLADYLPWGSGFGSFEYVYKIYEPQNLLTPNYLNQAHNDWLQFSIEGGAPAIMIAGAAFIWSILKFSKLAKHWRHSRHSKYSALMAAFVMMLFLVGSLGDYPLRVPSLIAVFGVMGCVLADSQYSIQGELYKSDE